MRLSRLLSLLLFVLSLGCSSTHKEPVDAGLWKGAPFTVVVFFSAHCPTQRTHDARLVELYRAYTDRGVRFVVVDAEAGASAERSAEEARARGFPFEIVPDPEGKVADALGARLSTHVVILDDHGKVWYKGGIDSDRIKLHDDAKRYVADALDDLLAGRVVRVPEAKTLGCPLERR